MEQGKFAYRANLEKARKAALDQGDTKFASQDSKELLDGAKQGLMRPRARPTSEDPGGFGVGLMRGIQQTKAKEEEESAAPESSPRPSARPGSVTPTDMSDKEILALTLQAEAGGEGLDGMIAAGAVIRNRADSGKYGKGIRGVIMKKGQFSAWNSVTGYAGGEGGIDMGRIRPSKEAWLAAEKLLSGDYKDMTGGATHYYNPNVATPEWGSTAGGNWVDIGNHRFGFGNGSPGKA